MLAASSRVLRIAIHFVQALPYCRDQTFFFCGRYMQKTWKRNIGRLACWKNFVEKKSWNSETGRAGKDKSTVTPRKGLRACLYDTNFTLRYVVMSRVGALSSFPYFFFFSISIQFFRAVENSVLRGGGYSWLDVSRQEPRDYLVISFTFNRISGVWALLRSVLLCSYPFFRKPLPRNAVIVNLYWTQDIRL